MSLRVESTCFLDSCGPKSLCSATRLQHSTTNRESLKTKKAGLEPTFSLETAKAFALKSSAAELFRVTQTHGPDATFRGLARADEQRPPPPAGGNCDSVTWTPPFTQSASVPPTHLRNSWRTELPLATNSTTKRQFDTVFTTSSYRLDNNLSTQSSNNPTQSKRRTLRESRETSPHCIST